MKIMLHNATFFTFIRTEERNGKKKGAGFFVCFVLAYVNKELMSKKVTFATR